MALGNCRMHSYRYSILSSGAVKKVGKGREGRFYIAAKLNKRFRSARAMKMTIKIALNLWHTKTGTKRDSNKQRPFYYSLPPLAPSPIISLAFWQRERHLALGTDFCSLKKTQSWRRDVTLPGATVARTDFAQLMAAKRPTEWAGVQCWAGYHAPCYPLGKESRAIIAPLCENLCQVSVSPLNLT